ncbi:bifunctional diaminohydroxyphosphoribosylaminopyrimidine deaminase/5-amino-6-(5-phosphoribosylamino)uracil reductase RibD [Parabacteroides sp. PF5-9]|uniref:bifunctional diaminohydroxyphosphoribosylaminopyrimidine deaminase/5-amino-6-(5-phosphoribosylamino)uracil reductase RibD n=1 Tax=Parabacteroides sp. PF5-9 TaxID=1742404 RepID=UPI0024735818|nr:bifunctional diaminohydroxyphosphoribosylaminopyrimidine deaminase/5-amino-6-(5-phosphoribosylamino)uracil reductase RibD [Parabacteroides sp. PF5-9]MDH6356284.1 diaminohydroxyphosphoribosylaminopyrimidine deaminase/5-amino-6-(5-phosphoribosylamino)uracil reductase [Parabacteroides sp. PF5-9]
MHFTVEEHYMARCLELAQKGKGHTSPNPMVGAVVVCQGRIIGEGYHRKAGEPHAEVNAIASVRDKSLLPLSTLYVNLEPCSHYGKTPPCAELIVREQIPRVVIGSLDPFPAVSGRGVRLLQEGGVEVVTGILEKESRELNRVFMTFQEKNRPYIILKWAESADGFIDRFRSDASVPPTVFSSPATRQLVHKLRSEVAAILVGTRTAILDNPSLSVRDWSGRSLVRLTIDRDGRIPAHYHLLDGNVRTLIFTMKPTENRQNVEYIPTDFQQPVLPQIISVLKEQKLDSLLVEGGSNLLNQFISSDLWDEIRIEQSPVVLSEGVQAPDMAHLFDSLKGKMNCSEHKNRLTIVKRSFDNCQTNITQL